MASESFTCQVDVIFRWLLMASPYTVQEGIDAVSDVIYHLETYDLTTIRAGTPMFLLARKIKAMGVKMVMSGEGADETLAGYLYFHKVHQITSSCLRVLPSASECLGLQDAISLFRPV